MRSEVSSSENEIDLKSLIFPVPTKNLVRVDFVDFRGIGPVALLV
jgi:hypothetical protein